MALITKCEVEGSENGPLADYTVGIKDSIAVAGVEMTCGSKLLEGYVPSRDATVVTRLLDAGATITSKTNMEDMAWSGSDELSAFGPVTNPRNTDFLAGGSSGGSAAAVAAELVDVALGTDQGGSVRMPASWCGIVGHRPPTASDRRASDTLVLPSSISSRCLPQLHGTNDESGPAVTGPADSIQGVNLPVRSTNSD
jgi:amidase